MNVKKLKEILDSYPDDTPVLVEGFDHSYNFASISSERVVKENHTYYKPDFNEDGIQALVIG